MYLLYFIPTYIYYRYIDVLRDNLEFVSVVGVRLRTDE